MQTFRKLESWHLLAFLSGSGAPLVNFYLYYANYPERTITTYISPWDSNPSLCHVLPIESISVNKSRHTSSDFYTTSEILHYLQLASTPKTPHAQINHCQFWTFQEIMLPDDTRRVLPQRISKALPQQLPRGSHHGFQTSQLVMGWKFKLEAVIWLFLSFYSPFLHRLYFGN